jgi:hypothetical protein
MAGVEMGLRAGADARRPAAPKRGIAGQTYGAVPESGRLLRIGSAILLIVRVSVVVRCW